MSNDECLKNDEVRMTNDRLVGRSGMANDGRPRQFDLEERTARFGEAVIAFVKQIALSAITESLVKQLVKSATSIGANYCEADDAGSKKEFRYRISVCKRESRETKHWLRMLAAA